MMNIKMAVRMVREYKHLYDTEPGFVGISTKFGKPAIQILAEEWSQSLGDLGANYVIDVSDPDFRFAWVEIGGVIFFALLSEDEEVL